VWVWLLLSGAGPAAAHYCGNFSINVPVGQELLGVQVVTADLREQDTHYTVKLWASPGYLQITPAHQAMFWARDAVFDLKGLQAGTGMWLEVDWYYPPTNASGWCLSQVAVTDAAANQPPFSLLLSPPMDLPINVPSGGGLITLPVEGTVMDDGNLRGAWINDVTATVALNGLVRRGALPPLFNWRLAGTAQLPYRGENAVTVRIEDDNGQTLERRNWVSLAPLAPGMTEGPPFGFTLNPPPGAQINIPDTGLPVYVPLVGLAADPDGNLLGMAVNGRPASVLSRFKALDAGTVTGSTSFNLRSPQLFIDTRFALDGLTNTVQPTAYYQARGDFLYDSTLPQGTAEVSVHAWDAAGRTVDLTRLFTLVRSASTQSRPPTGIAVNSAMGTALHLADPTRPTLLPVSGTLDEPDGDLIDVTINGLPVPFSLNADGSYSFSGSVIIPALGSLPGSAKRTAAGDTLSLVIRAEDLGGRVTQWQRELVLAAGVPVTHTYNLPERWCLVSLPGAVPDSTLAAVFPSALGLFAFADTYQDAAGLLPGVGYWLHLAAATQVTITANRFAPDRLRRGLPAGWSLVGGGEVPLDVAALKQLYPHLTSVYGFAQGYRRAATMAPGQGYWVRLAAADTLDLSGSVAAVAAGRTAWEEPSVPVAGTLYAEGNGFRLPIALGVDAAALDDLPPVPPAGWPDARLVLGPGREAAAAPAGEGRYQLRLQGEVERLRWQAPPVTGWELEYGDQRLPLTGSGELTLAAGTPVWVRGGLALPLSTRLYPAYPNPFNPSTVIRYDLAESGPVRLQIYAVTGQRVRTLVAGRQSAGVYQVQWDGRDDRGATVGSGVYLSQLQVGSRRQAQRLVRLE
jgi:hypothetical protein